MTGVLLVDKPEGPTSHDVVKEARRALGVRRIGHTGTLDPFATGLLVLCVGPATRLAEYLTGLDKRYEATARLGAATDTLDGTGEVVSETDAWEALAEAEIRAAFEGQQGLLQQVPPAYSAKRVGGKKAYELARAGEAVQLTAVEVEILELDVLEIDGPDVTFRMHCSSGTYVRAVARDAGETLGAGAHLTALRRTAVGRFDVADAVAMEELDDPDAVGAGLLSPLEAMAHLPRRVLGGRELHRISHGQSIDAHGVEAGLVALVRDGELRAIGESYGETIRPRKVFV